MRLVPYHCLGSLWSQRDKKGREDVCWSVRATVRQFNRLANTVLASCLWPTGLRSQQRARLLEKWISVAEVRLGGVGGAHGVQMHIFVTVADFSLRVF